MKNTKVFTFPSPHHPSFGYSPYYNSTSKKSASPPASSTCDSNDMKLLMGTHSFSRTDHDRDLDFTSVKPPANPTSKSLDTFSSSNSSSNNLFTKRSSTDSSSSPVAVAGGGKKPSGENYSPEISFIFKSFNAGDLDKANQRRRPNSLPLSIERKPQDKFFFYLFIVAILVMAYTVFDAKYVRKTNVNLVLNGHDDWGNICGQANREIPSAAWSGQNMTNRKYMLLRLSRNFTVNSICIENCTFNDYFKTAFNRCLPKPLLLNPMFSMINITKGFLDEILVDSLLCWREIVVLCTIAVSFSFALLILIGFFVGVIIWIILSILTGLIVLITVYFWSSWYVARERSLIFRSQVVRQSRMLFLADKSQENWLLLSLSSTVLTILVILILFYLRKSLRIVSLLFKEAGKAAAYMPSLLLLPFLTLTALIAACLYSTWAIIYIKSDQQPVVRANSTLVDYRLRTSSHYLIIVNLAIFIWMCHFIYACQHYVTSASIAKWYFKRNKKLRCPILSSMLEMVRFHLGSLALGSLVVTGIKVFRILIGKFESLNKENPTTFFGRMINFLVILFEKLVLFINKNAYIIIALHGTSFCESSRSAFKMILSKSFKIAIVNLVADFILFVGKIVVVLLTLLVGIEFVKEKEEKLNYSWGPLLIPTIFSYFIAHCFLTVYEMIIDTLFVCFCEDSKLDEIESQSSSNPSSSSSSSSNNDLQVAKSGF